MPYKSQSSHLAFTDNLLLPAIKEIGYKTDGVSIHHEPFFTRVDNILEFPPVSTGKEFLLSMEIYSPELNPEQVIASAEYEALASRNLQHSSGVVNAGTVVLDGKNRGYILREAHATFDQHKLNDDESCLLTLQHLGEYLLSMNDVRGPLCSGSVSHGFLYPGNLFMEKTPRQTWVSGLNLGKLCKLSGGRSAIISGNNDSAALDAFIRPTADVSAPKAADDIWAACMISLWQARGTVAFKQVPLQQPEQLLEICQQETRAISKLCPGLANIIGERLLNPDLLENEDSLETLVKDCASALEKTTRASVMFIGGSAPAKPINKKGILVFDDNTDISRARWLVTDTRPEEIIVRCDFLRTPSNPILITGPSGTGKSQLAKEIHNRVYGSTGSFKSINCANLPRELMLGQMFGYAKGIHNMAYRDTPGLLAHCKVGTIFLDEVDRLDNEVQGRLLTLLDKPHAYYPLGYEGNDEKKQKCTASLVFATNKNISELLSSRILENDFYYRITNFFTIDLQPLSSNQEALEHSILIHWEEKKRQLNAMEYGNLEEKFPEAWKIYTDRSIVRFNGNHRDVQKLLQYCIFWLKEKKLCNKPETISAEEARALLLKVDHAHGMVKDETPFSELRFEVQVAKLAAVVADNPDMKRVRAAQLLGLDKNTNPVNRVIAEIKKLQEKPEGLTETLWKAVGEFVKERKEKG